MAILHSFAVTGPVPAIPLAMFGLVLSLLVFDAIDWFLSVTVYPAVSAATGSGRTWFIGSLVIVGLITYLHWQLAVRLFKLIVAVPDRVSR